MYYVPFLFQYNRGQSGGCSPTNIILEEGIARAHWNVTFVLKMAGTFAVAGEVFVDALPYFDQGYDGAGIREAVSVHEMLCPTSLYLEKTTKVPLKIVPQ